MELAWLAPTRHPLDRPRSIAEAALAAGLLDDPMRRKCTDAGLDAAAARGVGLWWTTTAPPDARDLAVATRTFQRRGGTIVGWNAEGPLMDRPEARIDAPRISAMRIPPRGVVP